MYRVTPCLQPFLFSFSLIIPRNALRLQVSAPWASILLSLGLSMMPQVLHS